MLKTTVIAIVGIFASICYSHPSFADAQALQAVSVTTDAYPGTETMTINRDSSGLIESLVYVHVDGTSVTYNLAQLQTGPQLLKVYANHNVTYISAESDFSAAQGGHVNVRFMNNGITGSYKNFRVLMTVQGSQISLRSDPDPKDPQSDQNSYTGEFNRLFMQKFTFLGQLAGIAKVVPSQE